ncbi:hypothetical protein [Brumimicrobium aurantiacum]|uniref:Uncharacterized protein n=1 Tax=Brumimicrobium aurantiacum TaxID=1737063 RepID=A0A3E1EVL3_9FLAO|nr:hypothetical protein [Brumimicrobium aurantiacum]RFC53606.1 hypothetical protein DXU93_12635 [Brumimicrobium aurantiacum]
MGKIDKKKFEFFKAPIMALEYIMRSLSWNSIHQGRAKYGLIFFLPFVPIFIYVNNLEDSSIIIYAFVYFIFYLILTIIVGTQIRKIARQWPDKEYKKLTSDQVTFPFILLLLVNAALHFTIYYVVLNGFL